MLRNVEMDPSAEHNTVHLRRFDVSRIQPGSFVVVVGQRNTGNTSFLRTMLEEMGPSPLIAVSPDESDRRIYQQITPYVYDGYDDDLSCLRTIPIQPPYTLVLDCMAASGNDLWRNPDLQPYLDLVRQRQITLAISMLYALGTPPTIRLSIDYIVLLHTKLRAIKAYAHRLLGGDDVMPEQMFHDILTQFYKELTRDCIVFDCASRCLLWTRLNYPKIPPWNNK